MQVWNYQHGPARVLSFYSRVFHLCIFDHAGISIPPFTRPHY